MAAVMSAWGCTHQDEDTTNYDAFKEWVGEVPRAAKGAAGKRRRGGGDDDDLGARSGRKVGNKRQKGNKGAGRGRGASKGTTRGDLTPGLRLTNGEDLPQNLMGLPMHIRLEEMDKYKSAGGHVSYLNKYNLADKTIGCYLASVSIEDTIEILVIGKMKGLHHRAKFTLPEPTKTLAIKDYPLTMFDKVSWPVLGILANDKGRHAVPWACDTLGVSTKQISSALKGNNIKG
ncbi:hypothetical protein VOLCADRAFT_107288 [Volvox carteri f. nagariensis]|uniref:Uncharacterized protein n=1 Tax=Volvox carteri f. nagariensis TaxID=3068 RepID=D8UD11_VOLCA|nr:uncharacterized protein VOLCADRAFT_107288 [Volvox carteri f. nagariensis]EFJ42314.1 hypothetical protein VOLCADRAFT_107288 [Volvox carteri f. nagariensis]|eukprot:XP_002956547.1 hypothetical protein VOLCADRAFT_107288 [Volvox carteri f. nagariensis]